MSSWNLKREVDVVKSCCLRKTTMVQLAKKYNVSRSSIRVIRDRALHRIYISSRITVFAPDSSLKKYLSHFTKDEIDILLEFRKGVT